MAHKTRRSLSRQQSGHYSIIHCCLGGKKFTVVTLSRSQLWLIPRGNTGIAIRPPQSKDSLPNHIDSAPDEVNSINAYKIFTLHRTTPAIKSKATSYPPAASSSSTSSSTSSSSIFPHQNNRPFCRPLAFAVPKVATRISCTVLYSQQRKPCRVSDYPSTRSASRRRLNPTISSCLVLVQVFLAVFLRSKSTPINQITPSVRREFSSFRTQ